MKSSLSPLNNIRRTALSLGSLAALVQIASAVPTISYNTGSLGKLADGASTTGVVVDQPGAIAAYQDFSSSYAAGERTEIPFRPELNPASGSPFTIEFWARPTATDDADAPVGNRLGGTVPQRSGWVFFQRSNGWNFRMYNGNGTENGWSITAGPAPLNTWTHVVVVWSGTAATMFINGAEVETTNDGPGGYNANTTEAFRLGALIGGDNGYSGSVDDVAFYPSALTPPRSPVITPWHPAPCPELIARRCWRTEPSSISSRILHRRRWR
ncbi:LamG domain-containing protein [Luteolibacter sp. Populi]|uniref:LamG domain-containing protein n=1 Tax=Luteolibacter sp. Populi TaxID=3230487 RepID=UPI003465C70C